MAKEFSEIDGSIIRNLMLSKSYKYIADVVGSDIDDVKHFIEEVVKDTVIVTYQMKLDEHKRLAKKEVVKIERAPKYAIDMVKQVPKRKKIVKEKSFAQIAREDRMNRIDKEWERQRKRNLANQKLYEAKQIDMSTKQRVVIDKKTSILIDAGEDPEKAREKYFRNVKIKLKQYEY